MPSPERGGPNPEQPGEPNKEREQQPYYLASRFPGQRGEARAGRAYFQAQVVIFAEVGGLLDLSAYRFQLEKVYHVALLGDPPPKEIERKLQAILAAGEPTTLPTDILQFLKERRAQMKQHGDWVEGHYRPGKRVDY